MLTAMPCLLGEAPLRVSGVFHERRGVLRVVSTLTSWRVKPLSALRPNERQRVPSERAHEQQRGCVFSAGALSTRML
ncbi:MAG: hypothetical protein IPN77_11360 [Sandaracinaceae bacterium]|nr:hypothetical protein [Sandaracinaceae bacterium]